MRILLLPLALLLAGPAPRPPAAIELKGYQSCRGALLYLEGSQDALACYARTRANCQNGTVVLAYEKRMSQPTEKARYAIADTVQLHLSYPANDLSISNCPGPDGRARQYFVLCRQPALGARHLRHIQRAWRVERGRLVEVPTKILKCLNDDFGA